MNNTNLVTGYRGENHITSEDFGALFSGVFGEGKYVLPTGRQLEAELVSNNLVRIHSGDAVINGRHVRINPNTYEDLAIENGEQGAVSYAVVYFRYTRDSETGIEDCGIYILNGAASSGATEFSSGNILNGDETVDFPLYLIRSEGISVTKVKALFSIPVNLTDTASSIAQTEKSISNLNTKYALLTTMINSEMAKGSKILWQGSYGWQMAETSRIPLSEKVSAQKHGIKLVWSSGSSKDELGYDIQITDIDKCAVKLMGGKGYSCVLAGAYFNSVAVKYLYINDNAIAGSSQNNEEGTKNGITYNNKKYYLVAVIGY